MISKISKLLGTIAIALFLFPQVNGQENVTEENVQRENAVRVFVDCFGCDMNYIREQIPYVNYVRDVKEAQVYIMETMEQTGSGGQKYTFFFTGQEDMEGINDTLTYASRPDDSRDITRIWRTQMLKMGLMPYVARTPIFQEVNITPSRRVEQAVVVDRWNNWVFEVEASPNFEAEESRKQLSLRSAASASKVTHDWKLEFRYDNRFTQTKYDFGGEEYTSIRSNQGFDALVVRSLSEHWSAGLRTDVQSSSFNNIDLGVEVFPSVEYNIFPYSESTHRQFRLLYGIGPSYNKYIDSTIYDQIEETLFLHQLQMAYEVQEQWGSINVSLEGSQYLHDLSKSRIELNGFVNIRIVKGLSLNVRGGVAKINDQLALSAADLTEADILLRLQELATGYNIDGSVGITYTFGSIYNNIVNPRFGNRRFRGGGGGGGGGGGFF